MRLAYVINTLQGGGAERLVKDLAIEMEQKQGVEPVVIVAQERGELEAEFRDNRVSVRSLDADITPTGIPGAALALSRALSDADVDVVHSHLPFSHVVSRLACTRHGVPHVSTYHSVREHKTAPKQLVEILTRVGSDAVVCISNGVRRSYPCSGSMTVIHNAIDVTGFNQRVSSSAPPEDANEIPDSDTVFLNVARCIELKRQQDLIEAMSELDTDDSHLFILGDGPQRERLERLVDDRGVEDRVTMTGRIDNVAPYYGIADVFVSSSSSEGLPTTHIEAMAAQLPIVSTEIPGVTEVVEHGRNGLLVPVNEPGEIATALQSIQGEKRESYGEEGFEMAVAEFSLERIANQHHSLYASVLE